MRSVPLVAITLWLFGSLTPSAATPPVAFASPRGITIMTQNVYDGINAEIEALLSATTADDVLTKVAAVYQGYFDRNFPERAAALAAEIAATRPDLIGLQEALLVRTQSPPDGSASPATTVVLDYVQLLLDALAARGLHYQVAVQASTLDAEFLSPLGFDVRHTDREVMLMRADRKTADLKLFNAHGGTFQTECELPTGGPLGTLAVPRGWVAVDVKGRGTAFRLISTHLDTVCPPAVRHAQAQELLDGPAVTRRPVVLIGDFNSPAGTRDDSGTAYRVVRAAGFTDAALHTAIENVPTCCQDDHLLNTPSTLTSRIDFIFFRGPLRVRRAQVVGGDPTDRTPSGLWPSDHAGVVVTFELTRH